MSDITPRFMTVQEAAVYLSCSEGMIHKLLSTKQLTRFELGRSPRVEIAELDAYLLRNNQQARAQRQAVAS